MPNRIFYANEAEPEEQGGFCDTGSQIHYCNESGDAVLDQAAKYNEYEGGSDVRSKDGDAPSEDSHYNTAILETDSQDFYCPSKYDPGR